MVVSQLSLPERGCFPSTFVGFEWLSPDSSENDLMSDVYKNIVPLSDSFMIISLFIYYIHIKYMNIFLGNYIFIWILNTEVFLGR